MSGDDLKVELEASLAHQLVILSHEIQRCERNVEHAQEELKRANTARKAARNRFAETVQKLGVTGFRIGQDQ